MNRRDRRAAAKKSKSAPRGPGDLAALCVAGINHLRAERFLDAQLCCQQALTIDSNYADALHLMGLLSIHAQQYDHAVEWVTSAVRQDSRLEYLVTLGTILQFQRRFAEAFEAFDKAAQIKPDAVELWRSRGKLLLELNRPGEALLSFQRVLDLNPRDWEAGFNCGLLLHDEGRLQEAVSRFTLCDELKPNHAPTAKKISHSK